MIISLFNLKFQLSAYIKHSCSLVHIYVLPLITTNKGNICGWITIADRNVTRNENYFIEYMATLKHYPDTVIK